MKLPFIRRRAAKPSLTPEAPVYKEQKIETLKAGRLASLALSFTKSTIERFGPRLCASDPAKRAAQAIRTAFAQHCDQASTQDVRLDVNLLNRPMQWAVYLYPIVLTLLLIGLPYLAVGLFALYLWYTVRTIWQYNPLKKLAKPTGEGLNVHATLEPQGEVKQTLVFTAHHDSAPIASYNRLDRLSYAKKVALPILLVSLSGIMSAIQCVDELLQREFFRFSFPSLGLALIEILLLASFPLVLPLRSLTGDTASPGAGDNLASVGVLVQLARYFAWKRQCNEPLSNTRLVFCSFDGEEVALQGSSTWYQAHARDLVNPIVLNFDSIYYADRLTFLERDINGTCPLSSRLARACVRIARSMGYEAVSESIPRLVGGTDAASASRMGIEATTLTAVAWDDRTKPSVYHTSNDTVEAIEPKALEMAISVAVRLAELVDTDQLWEERMPEPEDRPEEEAPVLVFSKLTSR